LRAVKQKLATMKLEVLPNRKAMLLLLLLMLFLQILKSGESVIQLESAIGGAIRNFERARVVFANRSRFLPVKKSQDLLVVMGNAFVIDKASGILCLNPERKIPRAPVVHLSSHYDNVDDFLRHFLNIPDMLELDTLTVNGDVYFGRDIKLKVCLDEKFNYLRIFKGNVVVKGDGRISDGAVLDGELNL
jgi:UTP--glucose-1-phosphate uridylyltransferase